MMHSKAIGLRLTYHELSQLDAAAARYGIRRSEFIRRALSACIPNIGRIMDSVDKQAEEILKYVPPELDSATLSFLSGVFVRMADMKAGDEEKEGKS